MPEPDYLYVAMGTASTTIGLMIGLQIAGLQTRLIPIRVVDECMVAKNPLVDHFNATIAFIYEHDTSSTQNTKV